MSRQKVIGPGMIEHAGQDGAGLPASTVIGADTTISGTLRAHGTVWIDGRVEGDVLTDGLLVIGEGAMVIGNVSAGSVICRGVIAGDIVAEEEVELLASASLSGTVRAPLLSVDDSVLINDNLETPYDADEFSNGGNESSVRAVA
jgi:cytoskeletal protein CcmA (bactofilin family)